MNNAAVYQIVNRIRDQFDFYGPLGSGQLLAYDGTSFKLRALSSGDIPTISETQVNNLVTDLSQRVPTTRNVNTTAPLTGGGTLAFDLTLSMPKASASQSGYLGGDDWAKFNTGGTPAGSDTQILYNASGVFGASSGLIYDRNSGYLAVTTLDKTQIRFTRDASSGGSLTTSTTAGTSYLAANAYYDGTHWQRFNTLQPAWVNVLASGDRFIIQRAASGVNPVSSFANLFTISSLGNVTINPTTSTTVGLIVQGAASQTADLAQFQNNAGTSLVKVNSNGTVDWPAGSFGAPSSSSSWKLNLYDNGTVGNSYGIGIDSQTLWYNTQFYHKWYVGAGANAIMSLDSTGRLTASAFINSPQTINIVAASGNTDASLGSYFRITANNNFKLVNPTNGLDAQKVIWEITQDATGSRVITLDTKFALGTDISSVVLSTTANKTDFLTAIYNSSADKWRVVSLVRGY